MSYSDIGALSVRLNLETGSFNKKISAINKEIKFLERDFKSAGKGIKNFENSFKGLSEKITKLNKQIALSGDKLSKQKQQMKEYSNSLREQRRVLTELEREYGKSSSQYKEQAKLIGQTTSKMRSLGTAISATKGQIREYNSQLSEAKGKMANISNTTQTFAQKLKVAQQESKLASTHFGAMINSLEEGSFKRASAEMEQMSLNLKAAKNEAKVYSDEIKRLERSQRTLASTEERLTSEIEDVGKELSKAKENYGENSRQVEKLTAKLGELKSKLAETKSQYRENASSIREHSTEMNRLESQIATTSQRLRTLPIETVSNRFQNAGRTMMNTGAVLSASIGLPMMMVGKSAVTTAMNFEEGMSKVQAITVASADDMAKMEEQARHLGATTQFSATESAEAMSYLGMAGLNTNEIMTAMPATLDIAKAGMLELGETADITTNIMSGFQMSAEDLSHIGDVLAYASSNANTNIQQMGEAMVYLAPIGATLGLELEDVSSAVMTLSNSGIQGARAGAAFSTSLVRLTKPTAQMEKLMDELGISFQTSEGKLKPISEIVTHLKDKFEGLTDAEKSAAINTLFGAEATKHWSSLLNEQDGVLEANTKALKNADGSAKRMAETMSDNLAGSVKQMKSKLEEMAITIGNALRPSIERATETIGKLTDWFAKLSPSTQETIIKMGALAIALPLVTTVLGGLTSGIGKLYKGFNLINRGATNVVGRIANVGSTSATVASGMSRIAPLLTNPWTALAGAVAVGGVALWQFKKSCDRDFDEISKKAKNTITGVGDYLEKDLPEKLKNATSKISEVEFFDDSTKAVLMRNVNDLEKALDSGKKNIDREVGNIVTSISNNMNKIPPEMRQTVANGMSEFLSALYADGKIAEARFKGWIDELNQHADIKIEVNYEELATKNKMSYIFNDFVAEMESVGSRMNPLANDITQTVQAVSNALSTAKDEDIETVRLLAQGIAEHVGSIKMSSEEQRTVLKEMSAALTESFNPEVAATQLAELSSAMGLGFDELSFIQTRFIADYSTRTGALQTDTARAYADFIAETGNFSLMLAGEFGNLSQGNAQFWVDFTNRIATSSEDVKVKANDLVTSFVQEMKSADSPEAIMGVARVMTEFISTLVETNKLSTNEASQMVANINKQLGGITPEVSTTINANIGEFSKGEREVLLALGAIDKETAESDILADISPAVKSMKEYQDENQSVVRKVEGNKAKIDANNEPALKKIKDVNDKKVNDKEAIINLKWGGIPKAPTLPPLTQTIKVQRSMPALANEEGTEFALARVSDNLLQPFTDLTSTLRAVDYSGSMYRSQSVSEPKVTQVVNSNDSTMINLLQTMVSEITKLQDKQQTLEAQLYIDGRQLKSHFQTIEKRQNRLSGI